jgi:integrase
MASLRKRGKTWYYRFTGADGIKRSQKGCSDKRVTEEMARAAESAVARTRAGLSDPKAERMARKGRRPMDEHIAEFIAGMESKGCDPKHVRSTRTYIERVVTLAGIERIADLTPSAVMQAVAALKTDGLSARAVNAYLTAAKSLSRWLKRDGRTVDYSLETLAKLNEQADRRRIRRALTPEEAAKVIQAAQAGPEAGGLTGPERAMLYDLALGTGFRADELATLTPERFALADDPPTVTVQAAYAKNGKEAVQPIPMALVGRLAPWVTDKAPGKPVFEGMTERTAEMLRVDLEAAGIAYETASGTADFHALRAAYVSNLVASGASVKTCQTLARHSTPSLTIGVYAKASLHDIKGAVENLPDLTPRELALAEPLAMTGTEPVVTPINNRRGHYLATEGDGSSRDLSLSEAMAGSDAPTLTNEKPLVSKGFDASSRLQSASVANAPRRTRTYNPLIKSQLLCQLS